MPRTVQHLEWVEDDAPRSTVEETLAAFGLAGVDRLRLRGDDSRHSDSEVAARLRGAIETLGAAFCWFGRYISMRPDLIEAPFWTELGKIEDRADAATPGQVAAWIEHELGDGPEEVFGEFNYTPFASTTAFQVHRARLQDGRPAVVKIRRPGAQQRLLGSAGQLRALRGPLGLRDIDKAIAEFSDAVAEHLDLDDERRALESIADDALGFEWMAAEKPLPGLCAAGVLVTEALEGPALSDVLSLCDPDAGPTVVCGGMRIGRVDAARLLCAVWLRQALGQAFAADPAAQRIVFAPGRRLTIAGDGFVSVEAGQQKNLWSYLLAAAADDPGTACRCLVREMTGPGRRSAQVEMERRFRQLVPFRDGGWNSDDAQVMTHEIFCQWRTARQMGFVPTRNLAAFYRGFARVAMLARGLAPEVDAMREAVRELRVAGSSSQLFGTLRPAGEWMWQNTELAMVMARSLDEVLRSGPGQPGGGSADLEPAEESRKNSMVIAAALLVAFAAASLLVHVWGGGADPRSPPAAIAGMAVAGALLLIAIARMR